MTTFDTADEFEPDLRASIRSAIANLHPRPADINAVLEVLADPTLLRQVLEQVGDVHEVSGSFVVDAPGGRARVYVVRTATGR